VTGAADIALAARIERLGAESMRSFARAYERLFPEFGAAAIDVAGGVAAFLEPASPVNGVVGMGFSGEVSREDLDAVYRFFGARGERPLVAICPSADTSLTRLLDEGGWSASALENVLVREVSASERFEPPPEGIEVRVARSADEREQWAALVARGFCAPDDPTPTELRLGNAAVFSEYGTFLTAFAEGKPAGTGELHMGDGMGWLTADTTLPEFRRRGVQAALQRARLEIARDAGCELAFTEAAPGSGSQRNMERLGFEVVYTRVEALAPEPPAERAGE
jgi:GNAT superfamily N-acetyltransferase